MGFHSYCIYKIWKLSDLILVTFLWIFYIRFQSNLDKGKISLAMYLNSNYFTKKKNKFKIKVFHHQNQSIHHHQNQWSLQLLEIKGLYNCPAALQNSPNTSKFIILHLFLNIYLAKNIFFLLKKYFFLPLPKYSLFYSYRPLSPDLWNQLNLQEIKDIIW